MRLALVLSLFLTACAPKAPQINPQQLASAFNAVGKAHNSLLAAHLELQARVEKLEAPKK